MATHIQSALHAATLVGNSILRVYFSVHKDAVRLSVCSQFRSHLKRHAVILDSANEPVGRQQMLWHTIFVLDSLFMTDDSIFLKALA